MATFCPIWINNDSDSDLLVKFVTPIQVSIQADV